MNICLNPVFVEKQGQHFNCGHCRACRLSRRLEWTNRLVHEGHTYGQKAVFVTLTYKNEYLPPNFSLRVRDLQLFFKRLRRYFDHHPEVAEKIRYYACGEYCPTTARPHYHLLIYGLDARHRKLIFDLWGKCKYAYYDFRVVSSSKAYAYVAGYTSKKLGTGWKKKEKETGQKSPFMICSKGIGQSWLKKNCDRYLKHPFETVRGKKILIPRYYRKLLNITSDHLKGYYDECASKFINSMVRVLGIDIDTARRHYYLNGSYMTNMRLECDRRLERIEKLWRQNKIKHEPLPLGV